MKENFEQCMVMLLENEGGYQEDNRDPGNHGDGYGNPGSTNWGVTAKVFAEYTGQPATREIMKALKKEDVYPVYKELYWDRIKGDDLPDGVDWTTFDFCVNSGVSRAAKTLQRIVDATADGFVGGQTIAAVEKKDAKEIVEAMYKTRQYFLEGLSTFSIYGKGWSRRNEHVKATAIDMI
jgi:lysozyme family protein